MQPPDRADQAEPGCLISWRLVSLFRDRAAISRGLTILLLLRYSSMVLCKLDDRKPGAVTSIAFITDLRLQPAILRPTVRRCPQDFSLCTAGRPQAQPPQSTTVRES